MCGEQLYTAVGDVAKMKLNNTVVLEVSHHAEHQFRRGNSVFKGLLKMVKDYRFGWSFACFIYSDFCAFLHFASFGSAFHSLEFGSRQNFILRF